MMACKPSVLISLSLLPCQSLLACAVMGFPLLVRAIRLSLEAVDRRLEEAAGTLGAKRIYVFALVTLPLLSIIRSVILPILCSEGS